jgi:hypothetical protein
MTEPLDTPDIVQDGELIEEALTIPVPVVVEPDPHAEDLNADISYAREQIKNVIDDGRVALNGIMELAACGDEARAYEVIAELMTAVVAANKELILIHKVRKETLKTDKEAKQVGGTLSPITIDKAVFVGRASEILRELHAVKVQTAAALKAKSQTSVTEP